jgi:hypothetical protein
MEQRIAELEKLAEEVSGLAKKQSEGQYVQPELSIKGQRWYRGTRELLAQQNFSGLDEFDNCYRFYAEIMGGKKHRAFSDIEKYIDRNTTDRNKFQSVSESREHYGLFAQCFQKARSLLQSSLDEIRSRELPVRSQLSFAVAADEFERAQELLDASEGDKAIVRASGVVTRVALERHLFTVADTRSIAIEVNPPSKGKPGVEDVMTTLVKHGVLTAIQKSELDSLFKVGTNCAHPKEVVEPKDVERLIRRGKELASMIL